MSDEIKTVSDLITALENFNGDMPVCIRVTKGEGFIDYTLHSPHEFFPGGFVCLSACLPITGASEKLAP